MTALDSPVQVRTSRAARRDAERAAASLVRRVRRTNAVALAGCVTGFLAGVAGVLTGTAVLLVGWPLAFLAGYVRLALADAQRRAPSPCRGTSMHVLFERGLHQHLAQLADELGVRSPTEVWVVVEPVVSLEPDPDDPVLYIGAPLLWHLDVAELDRLLAGQVSVMRAVLDPRVRPGLVLAARLDHARLTSDRTPVVGMVVRRLGRQLRSGRLVLLDAVRDWGEGSKPRRLRPTEADEAELQALREVEELEATRRQVALSVGLGLDAPTAGAMATLAASDRVGVLFERRHRLVLHPASSLLADPVVTDRRLAERLAVCDGGQAPLVTRADLPAKVWLESWRRERDNGLPVVVHVTGRWPRTLTELLELLARSTAHRPAGSEPFDRVPLTGALLARHPARLRAGPAPEPPAEVVTVVDETDHKGEPQRDAAVVTLLAAAVRVVLVEQGRATLRWDDVWGAQLIGPDDKPLTVDSRIAEAVAGRDPKPLLSWLRDLEVAVDSPWDDAEPPAGGLDELPLAAFTARFAIDSQRRSAPQSADVVVLDGWVLGYPHPDRGRTRDLLGRLRSSSAGTRELLAVARTNRCELVGVADPNMSVRLVNVTSACLDGRPDGSGWSLRIESPGHNLELTGRGSARAVADALRDLDDRVVVSGTARADLPTTSWSACGWRLAAVTCSIASLLGAVTVLAGMAPDGYLPGAQDWQRALSVLLLSSPLVLLCRVAQGEADRSLRRRADPPRLPALRRRGLDVADPG